MSSKWSPEDLDIKSARLSASLSEAILGTILETILDTILDEENSAAQQTPKSKRVRRYRAANSITTIFVEERAISADRAIR